MRKRTLNRYWSYIRIHMINSMIYKFSMLSSFLASIVEFVVMLSIWVAVYGSKSTVAGFSFSQMITYLCISQGITAIYGWNNAIEGFVAERIYEGNIVFDLLKPVRFNAARISEGVGSSIIHVVFVAIMLLVVKAFLPILSGPAGFVSFGFFVISVILGYMIMSFISLMVGLLCFYLMSYWGVYYVKKAIIDFFSGALIPLMLLPNWLQSISEWLPFSKIVYTPVMIYMGQLTGKNLFEAMMLQIVWCIVLFILSEVIYKNAIRKVTINGG